MITSLAMEAGSGAAAVITVAMLAVLAAVSAWRQHRRNREIEAERDSHLVEFND